MTRTRRQAEALTERRIRTQTFRSWLQDRIAAAQQRKREQNKARPSTGGGHGITVQMRNIRGGDAEWIVKHEHPAARDRRHYRDDNGIVRTWPNYLRQPARNAPYVNPARDLKPGRRLRRELRS